MKIFRSVLLYASVVALAACSEEVDPQVDTLFVNSGDPHVLKGEALARLYEHYSKSDKSKAYYEVVTGKKPGDLILNYNPEGKLLTTCTDPGSGWGGQLKNVDEAALQKMADLKIHVDSLNSYVLKERNLEHNRPMVGVKTNGQPN